jgi:hypothetical protein
LAELLESARDLLEQVSGGCDGVDQSAGIGRQIAVLHLMKDAGLLVEIRADAHELPQELFVCDDALAGCDLEPFEAPSNDFTEGSVTELGSSLEASE